MLQHQKMRGGGGQNFFGVKNIFLKMMSKKIKKYFYKKYVKNSIVKNNMSKIV